MEPKSQKSEVPTDGSPGTQLVGLNYNLNCFESRERFGEGVPVEIVRTSPFPGNMQLRFLLLLLFGLPWTSCLFVVIIVTFQRWS